MPASRKDTARTSPDMARRGSDLAKVDAHVIAPEEYDELPELTDEQLARGTLNRGGVPVRRGRPPKGDDRKVAINIRLSPDVLAHFRATGEGWQTRIDEALQAVVRRKARG